jgi:hypothetical protein
MQGDAPRPESELTVVPRPSADGELGLVDV